MVEQVTSKYSIETYLNLLEESVVKLEYNNGSIVSMAGGTINHGILGNNINTHINNVLISSGNKCLSLNNDIKVFIETANSFVFPDGMVVCGEMEHPTHDANAITNPVLVIEVLSDSTANYDRGEKFRKYCSLPSFKEYVLIDQHQPIIDILYRAKKTTWEMNTIIGLDKSIYLKSIDAEIKMEDIYRNTIDLKDPPFMLDF